MKDAVITEFAPVKVNLWLEILGRRRDGFHELLTVMETLDFGDSLQIAPADELSVSTDRDDVPSGEQNLAHRIVRAAEARLKRPLPAAIHIEKKVAPGTGLGAGSSDAAAALRGVLRLHGLVVSADEQRQIAADVGSDVAFFVEGGLALSFGRGEKITPLFAKTDRHFVVVTGAPPAATPEVYAALELPSHGQARLAPLIKSLAEEGEAPVADRFNRLEDAATKVVPDLARVRKALAAASGDKPMLSGSGSAFYFLCADAEAAAELRQKLERVKGTSAFCAKSWTARAGP